MENGFWLEGFGGGSRRVVTLINFSLVGRCGVPISLFFWALEECSWNGGGRRKGDGQQVCD